MICTRAFLLSALLVACSANAADAALLDIGDVVFQSGLLGVATTKKVIVVRVDVPNSQAKVRDLETGITEWVPAKNLFTADELSRARRGAAVDVVVGIGRASRIMDINKLVDACDKQVDLASWSIQMFYVNAGYQSIPSGKVCRCIATEIVDKERPEFVAATISSYEKTLAKFFDVRENYVRYMTACTPPEFRSELQSLLK